MSAKVHTGGCNCGQLRYEIRGEPSVVLACHCLNCQRQSGSAFSVNLIITADQLTLHGEPKVYDDANTESGQHAYRHFCGHCGSPILTTSALFPHIRVIKAGTLDERKGFAPQAHCWTDTAFDWFQLPAGMPASPRNPQL
jgi:hypothetical protein